MRFSIITVTFNDLEGLKKTITSVSSQTTSEYEHIVVDGASRDGTKEYLQSCIDGHLRWISEPDDGLYHAMNKGIDAAIGDYLIFLNAGDEFYDLSTLACIKDELKESVALLYGAVIEVEVSGLRHIKSAKPAQTILNTTPTRHQSMVFNREEVGQLRYHVSLKLAADVAFTYELMMKVPPSGIRRVDFPISIFYQGGISSKNELIALHDNWVIRRHIMKLDLFKSVALVSRRAVTRLIIRFFPWAYRLLRY